MVSSPRPARADAPSRPELAPVAVVELFTSEGCSSCPAADQFLRELSTEARAEAQRLFVLSFHVDYWDRLGWVDRFARPEFSDRQRAYARAMGLHRVYTPQTIVNGVEHQVGSNRSRVRSSISTALARPVDVHVEVHVEAVTEGREVLARVDLGEPAVPAVLNLAVVERGLSTQVPRGENRGRLLMHPDVVRGFVTVDAEIGGASAVAVPIPDDLRPESASVVAWLQDRESRAVLGAAAVDLGPTPGHQVSPPGSRPTSR